MWRYTVLIPVICILVVQSFAATLSQTTTKEQQEPTVQLASIVPGVIQPTPAVTYSTVTTVFKTPPIAPSYSFQYGVHDYHTGDIKEHRETRKDGVVEGYYSLIEPDGRRRIVHYTASPQNGFTAKVRHENAPPKTMPRLEILAAVKPEPLIVKPAAVKNPAPFSVTYTKVPYTHVEFNAPLYSYRY